MIYYVHVNIVLDFPITYKNGSVLCQSKCACLHRTVNIVVVFTPKNGNIYPKGRALMQMYGVVSISLVTVLYIALNIFTTHIKLIDVLK